VYTSSRDFLKAPEKYFGTDVAMEMKKIVENKKGRKYLLSSIASSSI